MTISTLVPIYAYQQHIIWNSFDKCMEIDVQIKYEKLNDDDLHCRSPSLSVMSYHSPCIEVPLHKMGDITHFFDDVTHFSLTYKTDWDRYIEPCPKCSSTSLSIQALRFVCKHLVKPHKYHLEAPFLKVSHFPLHVDFKRDL